MGFNFEEGTSLAEFQDYLFNQKVVNNLPLTKEEKKRLDENLWVKSAIKLAPNNLVVRHFILQDYADNTPKRYNLILQQIKILTYTDDLDFFKYLWSEGYSYWLYVKDFLTFYANKFKINELDSIIDSIDNGFYSTSYNKNGVLYPAPYGDLREIPLEQDLQNGLGRLDEIILKPIVKKFDTYYIKSNPIGFNTHVPSKNSTIVIKNGIPYENNKPFKFYTGYDKKYNNLFEKIIDTFSFKRIRSIFKK